MERYWEIGRSKKPGLWESSAVHPRAKGPFIRAAMDSKERELVIGQWGLIPWFEKTAHPTYSTNNARFEEITNKASFKQSWARGYRCIIPARSFDEPCWETGKNVWWNFRRADGAPWGLAGLWSTWIDKATGAIHESYTMLTLNADGHPLMSRMHKPDPKLPPDQQDKRSVVAIELRDVDTWLRGPILSSFSPDQEIYSIDECFLDLKGFDPLTLQEYGQKIRQTVRHGTGIPVCVGIADTKTLAKLANLCAKKGFAGADGVCDFGTLDDVQISELFAGIEVGEVWGIGRKIM